MFGHISEVPDYMPPEPYQTAETEADDESSDSGSNTTTTTTMSEQQKEEVKEEVKEELGPYLTRSHKVRFTYLGSFTAFILLTSLPALIGMASVGVMGATLANIPQGWFLLYSTVVGMAAVWAFGKEALQAINEARGRGSNSEE